MRQDTAIPAIVTATLADDPLIQKMAREYREDVAKACGYPLESLSHESSSSLDFKNYFEDPARKAFLIKFTQEYAGFALLNQATTSSKAKWNIGEFFIFPKFRKQGIGKQVAHKIWNTHPDLWEVAVIPENEQALAFWENTISSFTHGNYTKEIKKVDYDQHQPKRVIFSFDSRVVDSQQSF